MGNANVNQYWEDKLPSGYIPDQLKIENFIRTKYDLRKWTMSKNLPDPLSLNKKKLPLLPLFNNPSMSRNLPNTTLLNDINLLDDNSGNKSNDEEFGSFTATRSPHKEVISWHHHLQRLCYLLHQQHQVHHNNNTNTNHFNLHKNTGGSVSSMGRPDLKNQSFHYMHLLHLPTVLYNSNNNNNSNQQPLGMNSLSNSLSSLNIQGGNSTTNNNNVYRSSTTVNTQNNHTNIIH